MLIAVANTKSVEIKEISGSIMVLKRLMDIGLSVLLLPLGIPLILLACIVTTLTSKGPIIFKQKRVGLKGKVFNIYKIRTMMHNTSGYIDHTVANDSRITKTGLILRKTKIDELPQLFNVLKGDMSLVGPRPERTDIVELFAQKNIQYNQRHLVKPGITGLAQVNKPLATPDENLEKLEYDLFYINNYSVKLDLQILARTVNVVKRMESL